MTAETEWQDGWQTLGEPAPESLGGARTQLHQAAQAVSSIGKTLLPTPADHSNQSFSWLPAANAWVQGTVEGPAPFRAGLRFPDLTAVFVTEEGAPLSELTLDGSTLPEAMAWLAAEAERLAGKALPRDLEPPVEIDAKLSSGNVPFSASEAPSLAELDRYFTNTHRALEACVTDLPGATPIRIWPHHFDVASLIVVEPNDDPEKIRSVGVGMAPGDSSYADPYLYVTPWPYPESSALPPLPAGSWHTEGWTGAVLTAQQLTSTREGQAARVQAFLGTAVSACRELLAKT